MTPTSPPRAALLLAAALLALPACAPDGPPSYADIREQLDPEIRAAADASDPERQAVVTRFAVAIDHDADSIPGLASLRGAPDERAAAGVGALAAHGLTVLTDPEMGEYVRVMNTALSTATEQECADLGSSRLSDGGTWRLLMRLPVTELDAYLRVTHAAIRHGARNDRAAAVPDGDARTERMFAAWPQADLDRFVSWSRNQATAPASEACWSVRRLFRSLHELPAAERGALGRHILAQARADMGV